MKNKKFTLCDAVIQPGEIANLALPLPEQYSCAPLYMPIKVINGVEKGPCIVIFSVLKGNELNGLEIANRLVNLINPKEVRGTIIAIPVVNVYGLTHFPKTLPSGVSLEACFPGKEFGSYGERLAFLFTSKILKKADYCIELTTGDLNHNILPQVYCNFENAKTKQLAKAFQSPVITNVNVEGNFLRQTTEVLHAPLLVYQAGEAMRFDEGSISLGVNGVLNVLRYLTILSNEPTNDINPIFSRDEDWVTAPYGGILQPSVSLGQNIKEGDVLGIISDPFGADFKEKLLAPRDGIVVGINTTPLIHEGLRIFKIASFLDDDKAENMIEEWDKRQPDSYIS